MLFIDWLFTTFVLINVSPIHNDKLKMAITVKAEIRKTAIHFLISINLIMLEFKFLELSDKLFFLKRYIKKKSNMVKNKSINTF